MDSSFTGKEKANPIPSGISHKANFSHLRRPCAMRSPNLRRKRFWSAVTSRRCVGGRPNEVTGAPVPQRHLSNICIQRPDMTCALTAAKQALKPLRKRSSGPSREIKQTPITRTTNSGLSGIFVRMVCHLLVRIKI